MLTVCEPVRLGVEHQPFNAAVLAGLLTDGEARISFLADASHQAAIGAVTAPGRLRMVPITLPARHLSWWRRLGADWRNARHALEQAAAEEATGVLFLSCTPALLLALAWLCRQGARRPVGAILHGGLIEMTRPRFGRVSPSWTAIGLGMRLAGFAGVRFIVLEEVILQRLRHVAPRLSGHTWVLPHPVPCDIDPDRSGARRRAGEPIRVALLGLATPQKGLRVFLDLARTMHERHPGVAEFHLVGRVHADCVSLAADHACYLHTRPASDSLPRADYRAALGSMDYACFFFEGRHYEMTASGVMLDCMALGLPVIGRHSPMLDMLAGRVGPIGLLCDAGGETAALLEAVRLRDDPEYAGFAASMLTLGRERSVGATGARLRKLLRPEPPR